VQLAHLEQAAAVLDRRLDACLRLPHRLVIIQGKGCQCLCLLRLALSAHGDAALLRLALARACRARLGLV
jgi:hypothetical protein